MDSKHGNVGQVIAACGNATLKTLADLNIPYDVIHFGRPLASADALQRPTFSTSTATSITTPTSTTTSTSSTTTSRPTFTSTPRWRARRSTPRRTSAGG